MFTGGLIATLDGEIGDTNHRQVENVDGFTVMSVLEIQRKSTIDDMFITGQGAYQRLVEVERVKIGDKEWSTQNDSIIRIGPHHGIDLFRNDEIDDKKSNNQKLDAGDGENSTISVEKGTKKVTELFDVWGIDSEFIIVGKEYYRNLCKLIDEATDVSLRRIQFDLQTIMEDHPNLWMGSFQNSNDSVQSGTLYGDEITEDEINHSGRNTVVGITVEYEDNYVKCRIERDGFVQIIQPSNFNRSEFSHFVSDVLMDYAV